MADRRALVANASSARQVKKADAFEKLEYRRFITALSNVLGTPDGVFVYWWFLNHWSAYRSVFSSDALTMAFQSGKQDVAHEMIVLANEAREDAIGNINAYNARRAREVEQVAGSNEPDESELREDSDG